MKMTVRASILAGMAALLLAPANALAQDPEFDEATIERGRVVYRDIGYCSFCHGWLGTGGLPGDEGAAGPALVETFFAYEGIIDWVSCGTQAGMPQHLRTAWTEARRCFGMVVADLDGPPPPRAEQYLRQNQIEDVAAYIVSIYKGKEMTFENCTKYWGENSRNCRRYQN